MTGSFWRMLANGNPKRSHFYKLWPIHSQQINRRCSHIRESNNNKSADGPIEVIKPAIAMRMKQAGFQALVSDSGYPIRFMPIAGRARESEVFELCRTAKRQRKNVFNFKSYNGECLTGTAISAAMREMCPNSSPDFGGNIVAQLYNSTPQS